MWRQPDLDTFDTDELNAQEQALESDPPPKPKGFPKEVQIVRLEDVKKRET